MVQAISERFQEMDIETLSAYFMDAVAYNAIDIALCVALPNAYLTYAFTRSLIGACYHTSNLIADGFMLADALEKNDMHAFGKTLVQTCEDAYYAFKCSRGLKDATTGLLHAAKGSNRGGGSSKERYKKPIVENKDGIFKLEFGKKLKNNSMKTNKSFQNEPIYRVTQNIKGTSLKKGYHFYLDKQHKDHIEVFGKKGTLKTVLNLDGSYNKDKHERARNEGRSIKDILK